MKYRILKGPENVIPEKNSKAKRGGRRNEEMLNILAGFEFIFLLFANLEGNFDWELCGSYVTGLTLSMLD
jgi:hypothetical protein